MEKRIISTEHAPAAIGPYSQAVAAGNLLFMSGQLPVDPATGKLVDGDIAKRTEQILKNAAQIAKAAGSDLSRVVKTTVFLTDLGDFSLMNQAYGAGFAELPPARSTIQVAALPLGSTIEIEFILAL